MVDTIDLNQTLIQHSLQQFEAFLEDDDNFKASEAIIEDYQSITIDTLKTIIQDKNPQLIRDIEQRVKILEENEQRVLYRDLEIIWLKAKLNYLKRTAAKNREAVEKAAENELQSSVLEGNLSNYLNNIEKIIETLTALEATFNSQIEEYKKIKSEYSYSKKIDYINNSELPKIRITRPVYEQIKNHTTTSLQSLSDKKDILNKIRAFESNIGIIETQYKISYPIPKNKPKPISFFSKLTSVRGKQLSFPNLKAAQEPAVKGMFQQLLRSFRLWFNPARFLLNLHELSLHITSAKTSDSLEKNSNDTGRLRKVLEANIDSLSPKKRYYLAEKFVPAVLFLLASLNSIEKSINQAEQKKTCRNLIFAIETMCHKLGIDLTLAYSKNPKKYEIKVRKTLTRLSEKSNRQQPYQTQKQLSG